MLLCNIAMVSIHRRNTSILAHTPKQGVLAKKANCMNKQRNTTKTKRVVKRKSSRTTKRGANRKWYLVEGSAKIRLFFVHCYKLHIVINPLAPLWELNEVVYQLCIVRVLRGLTFAFTLHKAYLRALDACNK